MKILLVEDDLVLAQVITQQLTTQHYVIDRVNNGASGWSYASAFDYDLLILDLKLPQLNGIDLCQKLRAEGDLTPILLLTSEDRHTTKIQALDAGADDYMVKPFDIGELEARIRALLRRGQGQAIPLRMWGELLLNPSTGEVSYGEYSLQLTATEYKLLELLMINGIHVISTDEILERLWSSNEFPAESTVRSHVRRLRNKLQKAGAPADFVSTLHGRGYYLKPSDDMEPAVVQSNLHLSSRQTQYLQLLNETWPKAQTSCLETIAQLQQASPEYRAELAHRLAGTLGTFGLSQACRQARALENLSKEAVKAQAIQKHEQCFLMLVQQLKDCVASTNHIDSVSLAALSPIPSSTTKVKFWLVGHAPKLRQELEETIANQDLMSHPVQHLNQLSELLSDDSALHHIIADWGSLQSIETGQLNRICCSPHLSQNQPQSPFSDSTPDNISGVLDGAVNSFVVLGRQDTIEMRLQALHWGGKFLSTSNHSPAEIIDFSLSSGQYKPCHETSFAMSQRSPVNIMLVDDDPYCLRTLLTQLSPLGFKVTTLADPKLFWTVLQSVNPDALVLDIKIPEVNGFELCQLVRNDPRWRRLPIFFLSILNDFETRQRALSMGADDYFFKPIVGKDLADCILHRLERIRVLAT